MRNLADSCLTETYDVHWKGKVSDERIPFAGGETQ